MSLNTHCSPCVNFDKKSDSTDMKIYETNRHFVSKKCNAVFTYNIVNILTHKSVFFN